MPNAAFIDDRITLDETSLDFRGIAAPELEYHLDTLNETLAALRGRDLAVRIHPWLWDSVECLDGVLLHDFLYQPGTATVSRDTVRRLGLLLDRCTTWSEDTAGFLEAVEISSTDLPQAERLRLELAFSLGIVLSAERQMACLVFGDTTRRGFWTISGGNRTADAYFFSNEQELCGFWRSLYLREKLNEQHFFNLAEHAFPALVFHPGLNFGRFDGSYLDVRDAVVRILGVLNDHFAAALKQHAGLPKDVAAALGAHGVNLSPESPKTRGSAKLMAMRTVSLDGESYVCEWHAKLEPHRNRIHFSLPSSQLDDQILIGLFVEHLDT
ncbi:hypothetical protein LUPAC06_05593 [Micromonospora saelicesensis]|uniref:hypothetical protein n=1 Tax=Micromonospora saelicesensis TaxID=285676 RepID=UPI000DBFA394|nr:hypothetical protein [Micromonospora saelicesensis]RAO52732.1 hypothetical protein LUPAC06_05593 [Micromonospora saelicesensis]